MEKEFTFESKEKFYQTNFHNLIPKGFSKYTIIGIKENKSGIKVLFLFRKGN